MLDDEGGRHEAVEDEPNNDATDAAAPEVAETAAPDGAAPDAGVADLDVGAGGATILNKTLSEAAAMGPLPGTEALNAIADAGEDHSLVQEVDDAARGTIDSPVVVLPQVPGA